MQGKHPLGVINIALPSEIIDVNVHPSKTEIEFQDERVVFGAVQKAVRQVLVQSTPVPQIEERKVAFGTTVTPISGPQGPVNWERLTTKARTSPEMPSPTPLDHPAIAASSGPVSAQLYRSRRAGGIVPD